MSHAASSKSLDGLRVPLRALSQGIAVPCVEQTRYLSGGQLLDWNGPFTDVLCAIGLEGSAPAGQLRIGSLPRMDRSASLGVIQPEPSYESCRTDPPSRGGAH